MTRVSIPDVNIKKRIPRDLHIRKSLENEIKAEINKEMKKRAPGAFAFISFVTVHLCHGAYVYAYNVKYKNEKVDSSGKNIQAKIWVEQ